MSRFTEPKTVKEYLAMCDFISKFHIRSCVECGAEFKWRMRKGQPPNVCSEACRKGRNRQRNANYQRRWRYRHRNR